MEEELDRPRCAQNWPGLGVLRTGLLYRLGPCGGVGSHGHSALCTCSVGNLLPLALRLLGLCP